MLALNDYFTGDKVNKIAEKYYYNKETSEWIEESYYAMNTTARKKFMERMVKKTNNLNIDRYFTWKPLFYE